MGVPHSLPWRLARVRWAETAAGGRRRAQSRGRLDERLPELWERYWQAKRDDGAEKNQ